MASVFNGKEKVKTKNAQHKLGERKRRGDMKFNWTAEEKGKYQREWNFMRLQKNLRLQQVLKVMEGKCWSKLILTKGL